VFILERESPYAEGEKVVSDNNREIRKSGGGKQRKRKGTIVLQALEIVS